MAERSFASEVRSLRLGEGEEFEGEGILAVTKALLQSGVAYVGGYQGAPISHLMDVLADANDILEGLGVHFENSANEATAAATLAASVNYPLRGIRCAQAAMHRRLAARRRRPVCARPATAGTVSVVVLLRPHAASAAPTAMPALTQATRRRAAPIITRE